MDRLLQYLHVTGTTLIAGVGEKGAICRVVKARGLFAISKREFFFFIMKVRQKREIKRRNDEEVNKNDLNLFFLITWFL